MSIRNDRKKELESITARESQTTCILAPNQSLRPGMTCPRCGTGTIDYDGLLELVCPVCGLKEAGACT